MPWLELGPWMVLVSPLIDATPVMRTGMDAGGWRRLGAFAARLHAVILPPELAALLRTEDFRPKTTDLARTLDQLVDQHPAAELDTTARSVRDRWRAERATIRHLVERTDELGRRIRARGSSATDPAGFVVCHADFHGANVLIDAAGRLFVVDWDELLLAPRERDLMFVRGSVIAGIVTDAEADAFEVGYGPTSVDAELIAYYRIEWAVQDVAGYADEVLRAPETRPGGRRQARERFESTFEPGGEVETALSAWASVRQ